MEELIQINTFPVKNVLRTLLQDKTTGKNIIFATDNYLEYDCADTDQITINRLLGFRSFDLQPRVLKAQAEQSERTRKKAEVFTPIWICNFMNNHCDEVWFGKANVFNKQSGESWKPVERNIPFKKPEEWQAYVLSRRLEITCGEAPFLVTRYDATTGEQKQYQGKLFDPVVFNDAVQEFLALRIRLANYFDESSTEDIFDYIPPQKTNQIFTPKTVVKQMVDMLEQENPGCFDDPDKTFIDLYMKSGLYIAEIVKRLYNSPAIIHEYPDSTERLRHIFEKQVYGLAPTEIIYQIALHFILGFSDEVAIDKHYLRQFDSLPCAKDGTLEAELDNLF